jgi:4-hydroxy-2-oxoglutarate aldolase
MTAAALITHFTEIADRSPLPVLLYNVPKFTALPLPLEVVSELSRHGNVAGMKDSGGDLDDLREILARAAAGFQLLCGASSLVRQALSAGAAGAILAAAAAFPEPFVEVARSVGCGAVAEADRLLGLLGPCVRAATTHGVAGIKAAMDLRGLHGGAPRPPLLPAGPEARAGIARAIEPLLASGILRPLA